MDLIEVLLIILSVVIFMEVISMLLRKALKVEKVKTGFRYYKINELHGKVSWGLRILNLVSFIIIFFYFSNTPNPQFYILIGIIVGLSIIEIVVNAFFEWKHSSTPRRAIVSMGEAFIILIAVAVVIQFDLLNPVINS
ncbi:DUF4181 domain-containing protein [Alkalibacillus silvisoli]|uniref:DUF4181 domain-containing protein n=1 Tax=Alkalibacillus silvisoli TaxID=392823 RepID=A0ABN0ZUY8_9BACI